MLLQFVEKIPTPAQQSPLCQMHIAYRCFHLCAYITQFRFCNIGNSTNSIDKIMSTALAYACNEQWKKWLPIQLQTELHYTECDL